MATTCKHPRVRIVSRHEDTEYVECLECGEVFDSEEFRDMEIEETAEPRKPSQTTSKTRNQPFQCPIELASLGACRAAVASYLLRDRSP